MCKSRGRVFQVEEVERVKFLKSENFWFIAGTARELVRLEIWGGLGDKVGGETQTQPCYT